MKRKLKYQIKVTTRVDLEANYQKGTSSVLETNILLEIHPKKASIGFKDKEGLPTERGIKAQTQGLVQGLIANIHYAHQSKKWDSAEHLRYIINELERGFVARVEATKGFF